MEQISSTLSNLMRFYVITMDEPELLHYKNVLPLIIEP